VSLARGVVDLSRNVPPRDVQLVAATCSLVAREDLHPALVQLFVQAAARIYGGGGWLSHPGQFPSALNTEFPLARDAERYYRNGPPLLQRYLPFWLANLIDRVRAPVLIIHAQNDPLIPSEHAHRLYDRAVEPKTLWITETEGHGSSIRAVALSGPDGVNAALPALRPE
jgi:fermentation-respiration switch protein FrsA (DUF1100 family)